MIQCLILDDDPLCLKILSTVLRTLEIESVSYLSSKSFLEAAVEKKPQVVFIDLNLEKPKLGLKLIAFIRKTLPETTVVAVSTVVDQTIVVESLNAGAHDFLTKPFERDAVAGQLSRWVTTDSLTFNVRPMQLPPEFTGPVFIRCPMKVLDIQQDTILASCGALLNKQTEFRMVSDAFLKSYGTNELLVSVARSWKEPGETAYRVELKKIEAAKQLS
jgi:CheY-like chemotaxis protein